MHSFCGCGSIIAGLLYLQLGRIGEVLIVLGVLPLALVGGFWLLYWLDYDLSVAVGVGFIALAGVAVEIGVVMLVYLKQALAADPGSGSDSGYHDITAAASSLVQAVHPGSLIFVMILYELGFQLTVLLGAAGVLNYWACSELAKVNPATGKRLGKGYAKNRARWEPTLITDPLFYAAAIPAVLLFGISKGGFGGGLGTAAVPLMALVISPVQAAAILLPILCLMDLVALWKFRGTAVVSESMEEALEKIQNGTVRAGHVVVIRFEGPRGGPGMREMLTPTGVMKAMGLGDKAVDGIIPVNYETIESKDKEE